MPMRALGREISRSSRLPKAEVREVLLGRCASHSVVKFWNVNRIFLLEDSPKISYLQIGIIRCHPLILSSES